MKQRKLNRRKGFTLVELLVVIAILAVLATVSVVGYTSFTKKAKVSNDVSLTTQMNNILLANEAGQDKAETAHEAVEQLVDGGLDVTKLTPTANDYNYVWDSTQNKIFLLDDDNKVVSPTNYTMSKNALNLFAFVGKESELSNFKGYSIYLKNGYEASSITVTTGLDTGDNVMDVTYARIDASEGQEVSIRTNGGTLTVNALKDTVNHFGVADKVVITAVAGNSYHENGTVTGNLEVVKGRVELSKNSNVNTVLVKSAAKNDVKVDVATGAKVGSVAPTTSEAVEDIDASTTIPTDSKVTKVIDTTETSQFAGGLGTEKSPYLVATEEQFGKINSLYAQKSAEGVTYTGETYHFKQANDIEFSKLVVINTFTGTYDGSNCKISFADDVAYSAGYIFNLVFNKTTIKNIDYNLKKHQAISLIFQNDWKVDALDLTMQNIVINSNGETIVANGNNFGLFANYTITNLKGVKFINCVNNASVNNSGTSTGVFVGSGWCLDEGATEKIEYINCKNTGNITGTLYTGVLYGNGAYVGYYVGNKKSSTEYSMDNFTLSNVENSGTITSNLNNGTAGLAPKSNLFDSKVTNTGSFIVGGCFDGRKVFVDLSTSNSLKFSIDGTNSGITYKIAFNIGTITNVGGTVSNTTKYFFDVEKDDSVTSNAISKSYVAASEKVASEKYNIETSSLSFNNEGIAIVVKDDVTVLVFKDGALGDKTIGKDSCGETNVSVLLYAYNKDGLCIGTLNIK